MCSASAPAVLQVNTSTDPRGRPGCGDGSPEVGEASAGSARGMPSRSATLRLAASTPAEPPGGGQGRHRRRRPASGAEPVREVEDAAGLGAAEGVDRLVRVAEGDDVAAVAGDGCSSRTWAGSVSWYSSTNTS